MEMLVFGDNETRGFIPKTSFNRFGCGSVMVWSGINHYNGKNKPCDSEWYSEITALL
jgi:hypothetical protein